MKNLNLIRKLAHQFYQKTDMEYQELFSEAALAYCEAVREFNPDKAAKLTTFAYTKMKNHLINVCKGYRPNPDGRPRSYGTNSTHQLIPLDDLEQEPASDPAQDSVNVYDLIQEWPEDARQVAEMVLEDVEKYMAATPNFRRNYVAQKRRQKIVEKDLERKGWTPRRITQAIEVIQSQLQMI